MIPATLIRLAVRSSLILLCLLFLFQSSPAADAPKPVSCQGHKNRVVFVGFSADGRSIVSGSWDSDIILWDARTGKELATFQGTEARGLMDSMALSPDGSTVASGKSLGGFVSLWDQKTGKLRHQFAGHRAGALVGFSPDGKLLATCSREDPLRLWDVATGKQTESLKGKVPEALIALSFSPDGKTLALANLAKPGSGQIKVILWDLKQGKERARLEEFPKVVDVLAFSPDSSLMATNGIDGIVAVWDAATLKRHATLKMPRGPYQATALAYSADGKTLVVAGSGFHAVHFWDIQTETIWATLGSREGKTAGATSVAFSPDGKRLVTGHESGRITVWNVPEKK